MAEGINIGDAVLTFIGDTTRLDQSFAKVQSTSTAVASSVTTAFEKTSTGANTAAASVEGLSEEFAVGQNQAQKLGEVTNLAGDKVKASMYEARGEIALLGEEMGVRLPRHVRSFVAELPGVGEAMTAAFSATAVLFLLQALVGGAKKLTEWAANTLVFTQAMKDSDAAIAKMNASIKEQDDKFKNAQDSIAKFGLTATGVAEYNLKQLTESIDDNKKHLADMNAEWGRLQKLPINAKQSAEDYFGRFADWAGGLVGIASKFDSFRKKITETETSILEATSKIKADQEQADADALAKGKLVLKEKMALEESQLDVVKTIGKARLDVQKAQAMAAVSFDDEAAAKRIVIDQHFADMAYRADIAVMQRHLEILKQDDKDTKDQQVKLNGELEALEMHHNAQMIARASQFATEFKSILKGVSQLSVGTQSFADNLLGTDFNDKFKQAEEAVGRLGITLHSSLHDAMVQAGADFNFLKDNQKQLGITTQDVTNAQLKYIQAEIAEMEATGGLEKQIKQLHDRYNELAGVEPKLKSLGKVSHDMLTLMNQDSTKGIIQLKFFADQAKDAYGDIAMGIGQAFAAAIAGQESLGVALEKATGQVLEQIGAQSMGWGMYFLAMSLADVWTNPAKAGAEAASGAELLAIGALYSAAGGALAGAASPGSGTKTGTGQNGNGPAPASGNVGSVGGTGSRGKNVQSFANGGLISAPTLALVGDSTSGGAANEAVLPLDDTRAMTKIVESLTKAGLTGGGHTTHVHVKGMISPDNLNKVVRTINQKVNSGKLNLKASSTGRVTRRSP